MNSGKPGLKIRNHQVTRCLLEAWVSKRGGRDVIYYYDILAQAEKFSQGRKASFAVQDFLYAPVGADGSRCDDFENELAVDEGKLGMLIRAAKQGRPIENHSVAKKAIRACIALGYRSAYFMARVCMLYDVEQADGVGAHAKAVENMRKIIKRKEVLLDWRYWVVLGLRESLVVNEQPFRDWTAHRNPDQFVSMPLGPRALLVGEPSNGSGFSLTFTTIPPGRRLNVENHNQIMIETARQFIVADSAATIARYKPMLNKELVMSRMATDRVVVGKVNRGA